MNDESCARHSNSARSEFWRALSYQIGDEHADRLTWWVDLYLWWYGIAPARLRAPVPGGFVSKMDGPLTTSVPALRRICNLVNEARGIVEKDVPPFLQRPVETKSITKAEALSLAACALPATPMSLPEARHAMARVLMAWSSRGLAGAWEAVWETSDTPTPNQQQEPDEQRRLYEKYRVERTESETSLVDRSDPVDKGPMSS